MQKHYAPRDTIAPESKLFKPNLASRYQLDSIFAFILWAAVVIAITVLVILIATVLIDGLGSLDWQFLINNTSYKVEKAGILPALVGTALIMVVVAVVSFPVGVGAGIFLEEFSEDNWFTKIIEININNLAAVPSIIYGLLGLMVFVRIFRPISGGESVLSGALTLALLILPIIIVATREALRAVPDSLRMAGLALGATKWQVIWEQIFPMALPGILTGTILALSRAVGETAPLIAIGAKAYVPFLPASLQDQFTVMPIQIYQWVSDPKPAFHDNAAAGIIVLMVVLLAMNSIAVLLRNKFQKQNT